MSKKYITSVIIEIPDEKIKELKQELEEDGEDVEDCIDNKLYDLAQEISLEMQDIGSGYDCKTYFPNTILYVDEYKP